MLCRKCSKEIADESLYCNFCGAKQVLKQVRKSAGRANGAGSVYQVGKTWTAALVDGYTLAEGKPKPNLFKRGGFKTRKDALAFIPVLQAAAQGKVKANERKILFDKCSHVSTDEAVELAKSWSRRSPLADITVKQLFERWKPYYENRIGESTMACYNSAFKYFGPVYNVPFAEVYVDELQECLDECPRKRRTKEDMRTVAHLLYKYAVQLRLVDRDMAEFLYVGNEQKGRRAALTLEHLAQIERFLGLSTAADYIYCLCYTGFRPNEMLSLKKESYHPDDMGGYLVGGFKTEAGTDRVVPISPKIAPIIQRQLATDGPYLFPRPDGGLLDDRYFREKLFYPFLANLGIQPLPDDENPAVYKPYSCRHTFSNFLKVVPGPDKDKAALMGHTDFEMTKYYQEADMMTLRSIINAM